MVEDVSAEIMNKDGVPTNLSEAIQRVLQISLAHGQIVRGLHQVAKSLDSKRAQVCFISNGCSEPAYVKLVQALCKEHSVPLIETGCDSKTLGTWAGLCKIDADGNPRKIVGATSVAILDFGQESPALEMLQKHITMA